MRFPKPTTIPQADADLVRAMVFARERGLCRAWKDGHRFPWCTTYATDRHEGKTRGAGGKITTENCVALCHGCHMKRHGVGAWLRIEVTDANRPDGVTFLPREPRA